MLSSAPHDFGWMNQRAAPGWKQRGRSRQREPQQRHAGEDERIETSHLE